MNVVIRSLVKCLEQEYGVQNIFGAKYGFVGLTQPQQWQKLNSSDLNGIQDKGGSILGVAGPSVSIEQVLEKLIESGTTQVYLIGGVGTLKAAKLLKDMLREQGNHKMSIVVIPTSIDNNIPFIDQAFGFATATQESIPFIDAANVEAEAAEFGVGIIRMPGRHCGYFPVSSTLASRDVNICVVPELQFQLYGPNGIYESIIERAKVKGHCIIVVSDGAYRGGVIESDKAQVRARAPNAPRIDSNDEDSIDLALFMKSDLGKYAKDNHGTTLTIKYLDPRQVISARPANSKDTDLCSALAYVSVHSVMNGYTDYATCQVREQFTMVPLDVIVSQGSRKLKRRDIEWQRLILSTGQSNFLCKKNQVEAFKEEEN